MAQDKDKEEETRIPFVKDLMFSCVMRNKKTCKELIELIFPDKKIGTIKFPDGVELNPESKDFELELQKFLQLNPLGKSVRLDVYFKDPNNVYNIEMQGLKGDDMLPRRARMYSSLIDANILEKGMDYAKLTDSYVIFICTFDPFGKNKGIYRFRSICEDEKDLCEDNGRYNIYLNTMETKGDISFDLKELFRYINGKESAIGMETKSEFVKTIDKYVQEYNANDTWRRGYMTFELLMRDKYKSGKAEGLAEGKAEGIAEAEAKAKEEKAQSVKAMFADNVPVDKIAKYVSLQESEVQDILSAK